MEDLEVRPYVIVGDLGKGSFATVYRGYHEVRTCLLLLFLLVLSFVQETHRQVAIKTVTRQGLSPKLLDNLKGEIDILKSLSHRHITRLIDVIVSIVPSGFAECQEPREAGNAVSH